MQGRQASTAAASLAPPCTPDTHCASEVLAVPDRHSCSSASSNASWRAAGSPACSAHSITPSTPGKRRGGLGVSAVEQAGQQSSKQDSRISHHTTWLPTLPTQTASNPASQLAMLTCGSAAALHRLRQPVLHLSVGVTLRSIEGVGISTLVVCYKPRQCGRCPAIPC